MKHKYLTAACLLAATGLVVLALVEFKPQSHGRPEIPEPVIRIESTTIKPQDYQVRLPSRGLVQAKMKSTLAAQVAGNVIQLSDAFREGGRFNKGDVLLQIDPRDYDAALKLAEASQYKAQLALEEEQATAKQAMKDWQRLGNGQAAPDLVRRVPQLAAAQAELDSATQQVVKAQLDLERTRIIAPYSGVVLEQSVDLGNYVNKGSELGRIANNVDLEVVLPISANWRPLLTAKSHNSVRITSTINNKEQHWHAEVVRQSGEININSRQINLIASIEHSNSNDWNLVVGDYVTAQIEAKPLHDVFVVPRKALVEDKYVWRVEQGRIFKRPVKVLWLSTDEAVIESGLELGDTINITPLANVISGTKALLLGEKTAPTGTKGPRGAGKKHEGKRSANAKGDRPAKPQGAQQ